MRGVGRRGGRELPQVWVRGRMGALAMWKREATVEELLVGVGVKPIVKPVPKTIITDYQLLES